MSNEVLKSNKNYNKMRNFLRLVYLHGCYSNKTFKKYNIITAKQYRDYTKILLDYFKDDNHNVKEYLRDSLRMDFEYYNNIDNYLVDSYSTKSSSASFISLYFLILQILKNHNTRLKRSDIICELPSDMEFDDTTIYNYLKSFTDSDILIENEKNEFSINEDVFGNLSDDEIFDLYDCVCFFSNYLFPSTPGYYLKRTLEKYIKYVRKLKTYYKKVFLHRFVPFHSVLDDEIVYLILEAIDLNKAIEVEYHKWLFENSRYNDKKTIIKVYPVKIVFDLYLGRWYLASVGENKLIYTLRIDSIYKVKSLNSKFDYGKMEKYFYEKFNNVWTISMPSGKEKTIEVKLKINSAKKYVLNRIRREGKLGVVTMDESGDYFFSINVYDENELIPWLRSLSPDIEIVENGQHNLRKKLIDDLEEMKKNYGIV